MIVEDSPIEDKTYGEKSCVYIELNNESHISLKEICGWLDENNVTKMKWPEQLEIVKHMPMTPTRKVIKSSLRPA